VINEPLISVVTPFFNTEPYLAECIESVLAQTHRSFEYLLIDNQSTDGSALIAAAYAARDSRIRLVRTERFLTQVQNYNFALEQMSSDSRYCKMVQADDWLFPRCVEEMMRVASAHASIAIVSSYRLIEEQVDCVGLHPKTSIMSGADACRLQLRGRAFLFGSPTTLLLRSDVVRARRPFYAEGRLHEDTEAVFEILADHDFGFVHQVLSFSRRQQGSLMAKARDFLVEALDQYIVAKRYADRFLEPNEAEMCRQRATVRYYSGLADRWLAERFGPRDAAFWDYQHRGLSSIGEHVRSDLVARYAASLVLRRALSPLDLARSVRDQLFGASPAK
jgi:glycosyltransferase involved in cell wall biosynthesis